VPLSALHGKMGQKSISGYEKTAEITLFEECEAVLSGGNLRTF
jgi:hypothetical protein